MSSSLTPDWNLPQEETEGIVGRWFETQVPQLDHRPWAEQVNLETLNPRRT